MTRECHARIYSGVFFAGHSLLGPARPAMVNNCHSFSRLPEFGLTLCLGPEDFGQATINDLGTDDGQDI